MRPPVRIVTRWRLVWRIATVVGIVDRVSSLSTGILLVRSLVIATNMLRVRLLVFGGHVLIRLIG